MTGREDLGGIVCCSCDREVGFGWHSLLVM